MFHPGLAAGVLGTGLLLTTVIAVAGDPVLHEFFILPSPTDVDSVEASSQDGEGEASAGEELSLALSSNPETRPTAVNAPPLTIENDGEELEIKPDGGSVTPEGMAAPEGNGSSVSSERSRPDRRTTLDDSLQYYTVFNPSVVPWKRVAARDLIHTDYSMSVRSSARQAVRVKDRPVRQGYERFWGSILVRMKPGRSIGLPTVAPDLSILRVQTEPPTHLRFQRDSADNYFITGSANGAVRVNYLLEVPSRYFGGEIDASIAVTDLDRKRRPHLPPPVARAARRAIASIGVDTQAPFAEQLAVLVRYFRAFEAREFPDSQRGEDIYLDLTLNQLGVCRHRAFAFVVTAQGLGILARYVSNEAHAFVEVYVPRRGWLRIDLGGAAAGFDVHNGHDKVLHTPDLPDSLPQPPSFTSSYSYRAGTGQAEADVDGDGKGGEPLSGVPPVNTVALRAADAPQGDERGVADPAGGDESATSPGEVDLPFPGRIAGAATETRRVTRLILRRAASEVFRGDDLHVAGELLTDQGLALGDKTVDAFLVPQGERRPDSFVKVGQGQTDARGRVAFDLRIPDTLPLGRWSLYLSFRGDQTLQPSHSR